MLICVTHRTLCQDNFMERIRQIALGKPQAIMLREKDLSSSDYEALALQVKKICAVNHVPLIINQNISVAKNLELPHLHLSIANLRRFQAEVPRFFTGVSVHSVEEAKEAQALGASYVIAGHIFSTNCKKGVPPRGLTFLQDVCQAVSLPVYAIGGITQDRLPDVIQTGAKGVCIMSEAMTCPHPTDLTKIFRV